MPSIPLQYLLNFEDSLVSVQELHDAQRSFFLVISRLHLTEHYSTIQLELQNILLNILRACKATSLTRRHRIHVFFILQMSEIISNMLTNEDCKFSHNAASLISNTNISSLLFSCQFFFNYSFGNICGSPEIVRKVHNNRRLSENTLLLLESWYSKNIANPYLHEADLIHLAKETRLSHRQIKNWVSNRRRKAKLLIISLSSLQSLTLD